MRRECLNNRTLRVALAAVALVALAAVACDGDDSSGGSPSPDASPAVTVTPMASPGSGPQPIDAITSYIEANGLDGQQLAPTTRADCLVEEPLATPGVTSTLALGQFCLIVRDMEIQKAMTIILELPDTGETWEMKLEFDADVSLWNIKEVDKVSG